MKKIAIIGSGFSSLAASCYLAKAGYTVTVFEKNSEVGGRARQLKKEGFTFDMGPSWYWMPDIFEKFFADFGKKVTDYYNLDKLDPAYKVFFQDEQITIGDSLEKIMLEFERIESGSSVHLKKFIKKAERNYDIAINDVVLRPGLSPFELVTKDTVVRLDQFFKTISSEVRKKFKNPKLISLLEFPVLFLGAKPSKTPAFYSFMNFADFGLGTWHPKGGMYEIVKAMKALAEELGVKFQVNKAVQAINVQQGKTTGLTISNEVIESDIVISGADYHHSEQLLETKYRQYAETFWEKKTFAPSSLLFYIGFSKKLKNVEHHNLFFDTSFQSHAEEIYDHPKWPSEPLFYANFPSSTDPSMAPENCETGFFLIPIAPGLSDTKEVRQQYFDIIMARFEELTKQEVKNSIIFKESFCVNDFVKVYNSYKGNAYGMANTLSQTAFLRPRLKSKKVENLYFTGQLTVPGPGVPPALISGKLVSELVIKEFSS
ncbi:MAG: phytoene desaturase [Allomuricauda sp.]|nr:MAG: phytoene desaturase [Allomuricauda sp.]